MNKNKLDSNIGIRLKNVTKYYNIRNKKMYILDDISIDIPANINIGVLGSVGAGKSTFLRILGGIDFPNSGKIISDRSFSWPLALSGGFQGSLSGMDNAKFVSRIYGTSEKDLPKKLDFIHRFSELEDFFYIPVKQYSSGMKAKLGFAMSIAFDFDYYLIDETISVGDTKFKKKCEVAIQDLTNHKNVIMVSHDVGVIKKMCDAVIILGNGNITYYDDVTEAIEIYKTM